jgi:hypothetical protein
MRKPQTIYLWTTLAWLTGVAAHLIHWVLSSLSAPPMGEVYTQTLAFQGISFILLKLPCWLLGLLGLLILEFAVFGRVRPEMRYADKDDHHAPSPHPPRIQDPAGF